ncbi:unnamed protein product, partial [Tetraodon nigroviridis]
MACLLYQIQATPVTPACLTKMPGKKSALKQITSGTNRLLHPVTTLLWAKTQDTGVVDESNVGVMNGSLVQGLESVDMVPEINCPVEQAEEIIGTEATSLGLGFGMGLRLSDEAQLEDYRCIPVDHAIAVECDEQVLGELDVAGFEEFSRRIYALNENTSSFRRPRKGSDK